MKILVDADACPKQVKEILYRAAIRVQIPIILVANQPLNVPYDNLISTIIVGSGLNIADDKIAEIVEKNDLVITADIPLADRVVTKEAFALNPRGKLYTINNIKEALSARNFFDELRKSGVETGGPKPLDKKNLEEFSNQLDKTLTKMKKLKTQS